MVFVFGMNSTISAAAHFIKFTLVRDEFAASRCDDAIRALETAKVNPSGENVAALERAVSELRKACSLSGSRTFC